MRKAGPWIVCLLLPLLGGCLKLPFGLGARANPPQAPQPEPEPPPDEPPVVQKVMEPADPVALFKPKVNLTIYHLRVPAGAVSRSEDFWKHVDEQAIDIAAHDVLYKNGIRAGRGGLADMDYFVDLLERHPIQPKPVTYAAAGARLIELMMKKDVPAQILYDFDAQNVLTVRSYDASDNVFCIEFQPAPRKAGDVRVTVCPMVRTLRKRLVPVGDLETREIEYVSPEKYYSLNLHTDVPLDGFLVIAPSPEARNPMSLGHGFMVHEGGAEQLEDVVLVVPQAMRRRGKPTSNPTTLPGE